MNKKINYSPGAIANHLLKISWRKNKGISPMQLQKLAYFANGWHMALHNENDRVVPLINEAFQAWEYGPICASIYHEFKGFGNNTIHKNYLMKEIVLLDDLEPRLISADIDLNDRKAAGLLKEVWDRYSHLTAMQLSEMTHVDDEDNPWRKARDEAEKEYINRGKEIKNEDIKKYFEKILKEKRAY